MNQWPSVPQRAYLIGLGLGFCIGFVVGYLI
jgi:hypothetical protein